VVIAAVLLVQCFVFADGGVTAWEKFHQLGPYRRDVLFDLRTESGERSGGQKGVLIGAMTASCSP